ncbi:MAG TPA: hypothetical protein VEZ47_09125, partial [Gemmatirosa sp.]|nr:hypothetical protein [Gemmatirosa sp.]
MTDSPLARLRLLRRAALLTAAGAAALGACARPATTPAGTTGTTGAAGAVESSAALPLKHAPRPTTAGITEADLMTRLYIFADDSMLGREAGTEGNLKGAAYIARELQ